MSKQNELVELARTGASGGGGKNLLYNSKMEVAQRGTSFSGSTGVVRLIDRWHTPIGSGFHLDTTITQSTTCLLYTSPSPRDGLLSRMPSSA